MILSGPQLRAKVVDALDAARAVSVTLGPRGRTVLYARRSQVPAITKDGMTVAKAIRLPDPAEDAIWAVVREAAVVCGDSSGDGTTAAITMARAFLMEGMREIVAGIGPTVVRERIESGVRETIRELEAIVRPADAEMLKQVATVAANGDSGIASDVLKALEAAGPDGVTVVERGQGIESVVDARRGMQFECGPVHEGFLGTSERVTLDDPMIVMSAEPMERMEDLVKVAEAAFKLKLALVVVAPSIGGPALAFLLANAKGSALKVMGIRAPGVGDHGQAMLDDLAVATNGTVVSKKAGLKWADVGHKEMGIARQLLVSRKRTVVVEGGGNPVKVANRIHTLREAVRCASGDYQRQMYQERLARLTGGMAIIRVGGTTDTEIGERFHRTEDALFAARAAIEEGVLPGGGVALLMAAQRVRERIVSEGIREPFRRIVANAGRKPDSMEEWTLRCGGYDLSNGVMASMWKLGVVDSMQAVRLALQAAGSVAGTLIGTEVLVTRNGSKR